MKTISIGLMAAVIGIWTAGPVWAGAPSLCFHGYDIDSSERPNDNTILFHLRDGSTIKAATVGRCVGLALDPEGFTVTPSDPGGDTYCSNLVTVRLNSTQSVCMLGDFVKLPKK